MIMSTRTTVSAEVVSRMDIAFHRFRDRMIASNRAYLHDIAAVMEERDYLPSRAMRKLLNTLPIEGWKFEKFETPREVAEKAPDTDLDGVFLPPVAEEDRQEFFRLLYEKLNDYIREKEGDDAQPVSLPEEYVAPLQHCDTLRAPNLRVVDMGGVFGTWCIWPEEDEQKFCDIDGSVEDAVAFTYILDDGSWEIKTAFLIDATRNMSCSYAYCRRRRDVTLVPRIRRTEDDFAWKWRIFYLSYLTEEFIFDGLVEYLDWISGWYDREVHGDIAVAAKQIKRPPYVQGVTDSNNFSDWDEIMNESESSEDST